MYKWNFILNYVDFKYVFEIKNSTMYFHASIVKKHLPNGQNWTYVVSSIFYILAKLASRNCSKLTKYFTFVLYKSPSRICLQLRSTGTEQHQAYYLFNGSDVTQIV